MNSEKRDKRIKSIRDEGNYESIIFIKFRQKKHFVVTGGLSM